MASLPAPEDPSTDLEAIEAPPATSSLATSFQKLPAELEIGFYEMVAKQTHYFVLDIGYHHPIRDEHGNQMFKGKKWSLPANQRRATYTPVDQNYSSILKLNKQAREEGLKIRERIKNYPKPPFLRVPYVFINYENDIIILDKSGCMTGWSATRYRRFTSRLPAQESQKIRRLVVPFPRVTTSGLSYFRDIRQTLPNLKELSFVYDYHHPFSRAGFRTHECQCPSESGSNILLVDVSHLWKQVRKRIEYPRLLKELRDERQANPGWELKIRLVIIAQSVESPTRSITPWDRIGQLVHPIGSVTINVGAVHDHNGDGIYSRCLTL